MVDVVITEDHIRTERDVVLEERNSRTEVSPGALFQEQVRAALYLNPKHANPDLPLAHEYRRRKTARWDRAERYTWRSSWSSPGVIALVGPVA